MFNIFSFPGKEKGEKAILVLRRHWLIFFKQILFFIFASAVPIIFYAFFSALLENPLENEALKAAAILITSIYYLTIWLIFFTSFVDYYLDIWIVSNRRIINIEQRALFSRVISEQRLDRIQDITSEVHGIIPTIFDYGDVHIQTAGAQQRFIFKQVRHPNQIRKKIIALAKQEKKFESIMGDEDKITV